MKYAVMIDIDGDMMYVPDSKVFRNFPEPKLFDNYEDAKTEQANWNTGIIVEYNDNKDYKDSIRDMTDDERLRAMNRSRKNS